MESPVVLITGGTRGLGAAAAQIAARLGAQLALMARDEAGLARAVQMLGNALALPGDVARPADCQAAVERTLERFGRLDALVNNAGIIEPIAPLSEADPASWERDWAVNVLGPVMLTRFALPYLRQSRGRIVNVSSGAAVNVIGGWGAYSAAKVAINHLTRILASEEPQVTSLALRPGTVDTAMQAAIREHGAGRMAERNYQYLKGLHERGKLLPPEAPGRALAVLALFAPQAWSGELVEWDEARVVELIREVGA